MKAKLEIPDQTFRLQQGRPWLECAGELAHLHKETIRIRKIIEDEFERIEPGDRA